MVMVEVPLRGLVHAADVHDRNVGIGQLLRRRLASDDGTVVKRR
jgi:hypothetical protein